MIEETERLMQNDLSSNIEEASENTSLEVIESSVNLMRNRRTSLVFIQLLICSILIWSLLFMKDSPYGKPMIHELNQLLSEDIKFAPVEQVIKRLTEAVEQIL